MSTLHNRREFSAAAVAAAGLLAATAWPARAAESQTGTRVKLQGFLQSHIDRVLVDGAFLTVDLASGEVRKLYPTTAHPMIMKMGGNFVLCSEFRDAAGKSVEMDFYTAVKGNGYVVFRTEVANRRPLMGLMDKGLVERF